MALRFFEDTELESEAVVDVEQVQEPVGLVALEIKLAEVEANFVVPIVRFEFEANAVDRKRNADCVRVEVLLPLKGGIAALALAFDVEVGGVVLRLKMLGVRSIFEKVGHLCDN